MNRSQKALQVVLVEGITPAEAAERYGISTAAVSKAKHHPSKKQLHAAELDALRAQLAEAQAEIERLKAEYAEDVGKLLRSTKYIAGVAERGLGVQQPDSVSVEDFVLSYVKQLEQQLSEAQAEIEEWRGKHDVACLTITKLQKQYEGQLAATSKAMEASVDLLACQATNEKLREFVKRVSEQAPEKPDYWSSCSQCEHNASDAEDLAALPNDTTALNKLLAGVYEECAKVCENSDRYRGDYFAAKIRELAKQKGLTS